MKPKTVRAIARQMLAHVQIDENKGLKQNWVSPVAFYFLG